MAKNPNKIVAKKVVSDYVLDTIFTVVIILVLITTLYPFLNSLAISLNDADDTIKGGITFYPRVFTLRNYELVFTNPKIWKAYGITIARTVIGTVGGLLITGAMGFAMSRTGLVARKFYTIFCLIPMYIGGGLVPTYFVIKELGLIDNFWVYILPALVNLWNMILMRSNFAAQPEALKSRRESTVLTISRSSSRSTGRSPHRSSQRSLCTSVFSTGTPGTTHPFTFTIRT